MPEGRVAVAGGTGVSVGTRVAGAIVAVGIGVSVGGGRVAVGMTAVFVGTGEGDAVAAGPQADKARVRTIRIEKIILFTIEIPSFE